jgi:hypothetical protein
MPVLVHRGVHIDFKQTGSRVIEGAAIHSVETSATG